VGIVGRETAVSIAKEAMVKGNRSPKGYDITACELNEFWLIIFEAKYGHTNRTGPEYLISKRGAGLVSAKIVPHALQLQERQKKPSRWSSITEDEAINISQKDAVAVYRSLEPHNVVTCELAKAWRIIYDLSPTLNGGGPNYVVDKWTGKILYKTYTQ